MIYIQTKEGPCVLILETANLEELKKGKPAISPDKMVMVAHTPDLPWLSTQLSKAFDSGASMAAIGALIDGAATRPENPSKPTGPTEYIKKERE